MKRFTAAAAALLIAAAPMTGCHKADGKPDTVSSKTAEERQEETCEEAFTSMFNATNSQNGAELCLSYMYPRIVLNQLRSSGRYDSIVKNFNEAQNSTVRNYKYKPEITSMTGKVKLTDAQLAAASRYFVKEAADDTILVGLDPRGINITEGYEIHCEIIDQNGNADKDENECVVYIENDGWKIISVSAEKLEKSYPETE